MNYKSNEKDLIHPFERPMRVINVIIFIAVIIGSLILMLMQLSNIQDINEENMQVSISAFALLIMIAIQLGRQYGKSRANSIELNENQFPEIYEIIKKFSKELEMGYVPSAYLVQKGGVLNAFATSFFSKKYISINSAIFELAYLEHKDLDTLSFVIAHELAHLKRKHATTTMTLIEIFANIIPVWGMAYSRVKEYTCDRHALWLAPEGAKGMILLSAGKHLYKNVNVEEYIKTSSQYKGFFLWLHNLLASHPIAPKRIKAIMDTSKWGKVF